MGLSGRGGLPWGKGSRGVAEVQKGSEGIKARPLALILVRIQKGLSQDAFLQSERSKARGRMFELVHDYNCTFDSSPRLPSPSPCSRPGPSSSGASSSSSPSRGSSRSRARDNLYLGAGSMSPVAERSGKGLGRCNSNPSAITPRCYPHLKSRFAEQSPRRMSHSVEEPDENFTLGVRAPARLDDRLEAEPKKECSLLPSAEERLPYLTSVIARTAARDSGLSPRSHSSPSTPFAYSSSPSSFVSSSLDSENGDTGSEEDTEDTEEEGNGKGKEVNVFASVLDDLASLAPLEKVLPSAASLAFPKTAFTHERSPSLDSSAWLSSVSECLSPSALWSLLPKSKGE